MQCSVSKQYPLGKLLKIAKQIVWKEAPMVHRCAFEVLDKMLRYINKCDLPFGGKVNVYGGDFCQVSPIVQKGTKDDKMKASLIFQIYGIILSNH